MKIRILNLIALVFALGSLPAVSQTLNWGSFTNSTIVDSQGTPLDPSNNSFIFRLVSFDPTYTPSQANISDWTTSARVFDTASYSYNSTDLGYFTGSQLLQDVPNYTTLFQGLPAYLLISNAAETEFFLGTTSDSTWVFPALDTGCCPTGITTWSVSNFGSDTPIWGSQQSNDGGGNFDDSNGPYDLQLHAIPEAGSSMLVALGCGFALLRRRRRNA